jgi:hypothetical protein
MRTSTKIPKTRASGWFPRLWTQVLLYLVLILLISPTILAQDV